LLVLDAVDLGLTTLDFHFHVITLGGPKGGPLKLKRPYKQECGYLKRFECYF
jgi:hypothetical protein